MNASAIQTRDGTEVQVWRDGPFIKLEIEWPDAGAAGATLSRDEAIELASMLKAWAKT